MCECDRCVHSTLKGEIVLVNVRGVCIKGRECVSVRDNINYFVFAGSLPAFEWDCLSTKFTLNFILVRNYSLLLCSCYCLGFEKKLRSALIHTKFKFGEYRLKMP